MIRSMFSKNNHYSPVFSHTIQYVSRGKLFVHGDRMSLFQNDRGPEKFSKRNMSFKMLNSYKLGLFVLTKHRLTYIGQERT
jgi:hypothetical protein